MPSKKPHTCPICHRSGLINLSQHLSGVHRIVRQERTQLIQRGMVGSEVMVMEPQSHIEKHISFLDMLQCGEHLKKARQGELRAILELCLNMNEENLSLPKRKSHRSVVSTLANRDIPLSNKTKWMLRGNKMLYNIIHPALKESKRKFKRV